MPQKADTYAQFHRSFRIDTFQKHQQRRLFQEALALRVQILVQEEGFPLDAEPDAHDESALHWVVRDAENLKVVATGRLRFVMLDTKEMPQPPLGKRLALIDKLAVLPSYRHRSVGRYLMVALLAHLREKALDAHVTAVAHTKSITFFESLGFVATHRYDSDLAPKEGALVMERI